ncbi:MAG: DUF4145 domain-containing protein [Rhizobiales bacterium]|nr:DUF4145 domain-containing protein [Hyphomicrobiales bacterium]
MSSLRPGHTVDVPNALKEGRFVSWWQIGEGYGTQSFGGELRTDLVDCGFCGETGNFDFESRLKKENSVGKVLHYDTLKCEQCGNLTSVFWGNGSSGLQRFHQVPWLQKTTKWPSHWPDDVGRYWLQAQRSVEASNWDAAALMARSAVQLTLRHQHAEGRSLYEEINDLGSKAILPPIMVEWAHEVRVLGNENAHPTLGAAPTTDRDAKAVVEFLTMLLKIVFDLPNQIDDHRDSRKKE